jgi:hypothetical protein
MKKNSIFAASYILNGGRFRLYAAGIFCALSLLAICGFVPPCGALMRPLPLRCRTTGKAEPFFIFATANNLSAMSYTEKIARGKKHSIPASTPTERNTLSIKAFNIEKDAKNEAYYFILSHGLLDQFSKFCKSYHSSDPHRDCVEYLISKI